MTAGSGILLSVVIVAYRSREEIGSCLKSIPRTIEARGVEILVVDNSLNEDGTQEQVARTDSGAIYVKPNTNLGFGRANNLGFQQSLGECVLFLNPDTRCSSDALAHCLDRIRHEQGIGLISPRLVLADGSMDLACRRSIPTLWDGFCRASGLAARFPKTKLFAKYNLTHLPADDSYDVGAINGAFMLGRREVFNLIADPAPPTVFDESFFMYGDDLDLCIRVRRAGFRIVYDGRVSITHLKGRSVARDFERMSRAIFDANRDVYLKHFNPRRSRIIRWKYTAAFGLWKQIALLRGRWRGHHQVRPI